MKRQNVAEEDLEQEQQPPKKLIKTIFGQKREYHFLKTVGSMEDLDKFRFKNFCGYYGGKPLHICKSIIMPCSRKKSKKGCEFELMALAPDLEDGGNIHVYGHSQHNHSVTPEEERVIRKKGKELMPHQNPPPTFGTEDGIEWTLLETFSDYAKMNKFRCQNQCKFKQGLVNGIRMRTYCSRKYTPPHHCKFMFLAMKTTKQGYHVYRNGEHNHSLLKQRMRQSIAKDLMPEGNPPAILRTPDNIEWTFLQTFLDYDQILKFGQTNQCTPIYSDQKKWHFRNYCQRRVAYKCPFMLLALKTPKNGYHVFKHGEHTKHPIVEPKKKQCQRNLNESAQMEDEEYSDDSDDSEEEEEEDDSEDEVQEWNDKDEDDEDDDEESDKEEEEEEVEQRKQKQQWQGEKPPRKMYKNIMGQKRKYYYRMTVKSLEELDNLRYKNDCAFINRKDLKVFKSKCMPCTRKRDGKGCDFELMAFRPEFNNDTIHVYAYSEHNHPFQTERRWFSKKSTELIPDANPPKIFRTSNNVEWKFHKTIADYETMETIRRQNQCKSIKSASAKWRLHYCCTRKYYVNRCQFTLLAMKTNQQRYHVYKHGKHNHVPMKRIINQKLLMANRQQNIIGRNEQMDDVDEDNNEDEDEEEAEREEEEDDTEGEEKEEEEEEEEEENDQEDDEQPQQEQQKPLGKISKNIRGQQRDYYYRKTVKSMEELDKFCFNNYCDYVSAGKPSHILESLLIPCTAKNKKECDFELLALRPQLGGVTIHVYAHSEHNHSIKSTEMRLHNRGTKQLMPDANAPLIFRTADRIEWKFLQTFPDYDQLQKFRLKNKCKSQGNDKYWRVRYVCQRKFHKNKCQFVLLALKTIKQRYHVYRHCEHEHNHAAWKPSKRQRTAKGKKLDQQRRMQAEEEEDEDEEEEEWKEESDEESEEEETEENSEEEDEEEIVEEEEQLKMEAKYEPIEEKNEQEERSMEDIKIVEIIENSRTRAERLKEKLAKANGKVYKWMSGIESNEIGQTIEEWDKLSLLKMVEMADQEIREHPQKLNLWLSWLKCAIPKCAPQIEGFNVRFANLIKLAFD